MKLQPGDKVLYEEEEYSVFWVYDSGFLEITQDDINYKLVKYSEVTLL